MSVRLISTIKRYIGLSGDVKSTDCPYGSTFYETDTSATYIYSSAGWSLQASTATPIVSISEKTILRITGTAAGNGDNLIIAAPAAGNRIVVACFQIQLEADTETTMILKDGATNKFRFMAVGRGGGLSLDFPAGREWKLTEASALNLNLSGANSTGYNVSYYTEAV